jgi:hypothetical protein
MLDDIYRCPGTNPNVFEHISVDEWNTISCSGLQLNDDTREITTIADSQYSLDMQNRGTGIRARITPSGKYVLSEEYGYGSASPKDVLQLYTHHSATRSWTRHALPLPDQCDISNWKDIRVSLDDYFGLLLVKNRDTIFIASFV